MAWFDTTWYVNFGDGSTTGYYAVAKRPQNAAVAAGQIVRQFTTPAVSQERVYICVVAGTTANTTDATWAVTRGGKTTDGTAQWCECSGMSAVNGDLSNTPDWTRVKGQSISVGVIIKRNNGASYQIHGGASPFTAGSGSEPAFSDTAGVTTADGAGTWTSLGPVANFTGGQAPHARLANVFGANWFASGNTVYVGDNHAETLNTSIVYSVASAAMARIICHNHSGSYPPTASDVTTGATITTTSAGSINLTGQGSFYFYGMTFVSSASNTIGAASVGQVQNWYYFDNCSWQLTLGGVGNLQLGATSTAWGIIVFNNTTVKFAHTGGFVFPYFVQFVWQNTGQVLAGGSSIPTTLFQIGTSSGRFSNITLRNLDLSQLTGSLFTNASNSSIGSIVVQDCKLNAAMTVTRPINSGMQVQLIRSDSAATAYKSSRITYEGTEDTETSIVRTNGAVDPNSQAQTRKIVTSANAQWLRPFMAEPYAIYNGTTGASKTVTLYGTVNAGALPNNDDIWAEFEYLGSATDPLGTIVTTTKSSVLASNAAVASDSSTWSSISQTFWDAASLLLATLSNGNLTVTNTSGASNNCGAYGPAAAQKTTGKYYFEATRVTHNGGTNNAVGVAVVGSTYPNIGGNANMGSIVALDGVVRSNGGVVAGAGLGTRANGDVFGIAIDLDNRMAWFRVAPSGNWNNSGTANPATNTGGAVMPAGIVAPICTFGGSGSTANNVITANFGASAFTGTVPSGFTSGWPSDASSFKLATTITPQLPGYIHARVRVGKASGTFYIDPKPEIT